MYCHKENQHIFERIQGWKVRKQKENLIIKNSLVTFTKESLVKYKFGACLQWVEERARQEEMGNYDYSLFIPSKNMTMKLKENHKGRY